MYVLLFKLVMSTCRLLSSSLGAIFLIGVFDFSQGLLASDVCSQKILSSIANCSQLNLPQSSRRGPQKNDIFGRIRMRSSSVASTKYQGFELAILLDTETRRRQRLKRLEKNVHNKPSVDIRINEQKELDNDFDDNECKDFILGPDYIKDMKQQNSITSDSPAILLQSSAGTGKTTALAGRIAHLIQSQKVQPQNMIILSFTNRDADALKEKALNFLCEENVGTYGGINREVLEKKLWSGTLHSFAINILRNYNKNTSPLRIISTREMKNRIQQCLGRINSMSKDRMFMYKHALIDTKQSVGTLVQYVLRCLELWKEAGVLPSPYLNSIKFVCKDTPPIKKDDFIELAMRLGIPQSAAVLAYEISGDYQVRHT